GGALPPRVDAQDRAPGRVPVIAPREDTQCRPARARLRGRSGPLHRRDDDGQPEDELAAVSQSLAARLDRPAVQLDELAHQREADAEPSLALQRLVDAGEEIEDLRELPARDADAVVAHRDRQHAGRHDVDRDVDVTTRRGVLRRVAEQVAEHLDQALAVGLELDRTERDAHLQVLSLGLDLVTAGIHRRLDDLAARDALAAQVERATGYA